MGFSEITNPILGGTVHARTIKQGFDLTLFQKNTLISMYTKFGKLDAAHHVFDEIPHRNEASWNTLISGYVRMGFCWEAIQLFCEMRAGESKPNEFVLATLITACSRLMALDLGIQIHCSVVKFGLSLNVFVGTALVHMYATAGLIFHARQLFDEMPERNVVSWTAMMVGYSRNDDAKNSVSIYRQMKREGIDANQNSFATMISSCGLLEDDLLTSQVLAHVVKTGFERNVSVGNSLITMFGHFGDAERAHDIFSEMQERDTISWNSIISAHAHNGFYDQALSWFNQMRRANAEFDSTTLSVLISSCCSVDYLKWGMGIHGHVVKSGHGSIISICNTLITMYSMSGKPEDSELVFDLMPKRDVISWNSMITCYILNKQYGEALQIFSKLLGISEEMNFVTFASALAACLSPESLFEGKMIHSLVVQFGLQENLFLGNALITMYGKCGSIRESEAVFRSIAEPDLVTWNALIGAHVEQREKPEAIKTFNLMREKGISTNYITMVNILAVCSAAEDLLYYGLPIHAHIIFTGFDSNRYVRNSLLAMHAKCGELGQSNYLFNGLSNKDIVSWNVMIAANAHHGRGEEALSLFKQMHCEGLEFDQFSLSGGLSASADLAVLEEGQQLHNLIIKLGFESGLHISTATMDMYGKCGKMDDAVKVFSKTSNQVRLSWNILISGYARHGCFKKAQEAFEEMLKIGLKPDHVTFVSLLSACSHGGLVDEGLEYFSLMTSEFGIEPGLEHCVCIVDLLGRAGRLVEAKRFIKEMSVLPDDLIWRSLLSSCRIHGNLEMGKNVCERLLELDPLDDSAYVLLSNICASNRQWDEVERVRRDMRSKNVRKSPGCSWIKVKNKVSSFGTADRTHPQVEQIYAKLEVLLEKIKELGYVADTSFALHDTDEEQKVHNLWNHSEKLALAFGLIHTPEGSTLRIFKNLRVCGDCHSVYKMVSRTVGREIMLRDPYRFHHFSGVHQNPHDLNHLFHLLTENGFSIKEHLICMTPSHIDETWCLLVGSSI